MAGAGAGRVTALTAGCLELRRGLAARAADPATSGTAGVPVVVPIGAADVFDPARDSHAAKRRDASIHLTAQAVLVGPWPLRLDAALRHGNALRRGDAAPCGHCLARRWQRLRGRPERDALEAGTGTRVLGTWPVLTGFAVDCVWSAYQAISAVSPHPAAVPPADGAGGPRQVSRIDLATLEVETVLLLADPLCPSCGERETDGQRRATLCLESRLRPGRASYRLRSADSYDLPATALANRVCGAIGAGTTMNVVTPTTAPVSGRMAMRGYGDLRDISWSGQANSYQASRSLAFLEGLERYAGTRPRRHEALVVDSYASLAGQALDPRDCGVYEPRTYLDDATLREFSPEQRLPWVWGHSLRDKRPILVPARLSYYASGTASDNFVLECSNGCASGSSLEEAILFGLLELIERDAFLLAWYGGADLTLIDLDSIDDPAIRSMVDRAALSGYDLRVFDNRIDLPVPVATGVAIRRDGGLGRLCFAAAASLDPETAISAALSEILAYAPSLPGQARAREAELRAMAGDFSKVTELPDHSALFSLPEMAKHAHRYLRPTPSVPVGEVYRSWQPPVGRDLLDDLRRCQEAVTDAGCDVIVVDQTCPEQEQMGLHSVCVIAPGLVPIDFGWTKQRALSMPRTRKAFRLAGWRTTDLDDAELHRVPHPFP
jgi:ribosomal protein S12 methylthiotransferase accessory factor